MSDDLADLELGHLSSGDSTLPDCLVVYISCFLFKLYLYVRVLNDGLRGILDHCISLPRATLNVSLSLSLSLSAAAAAAAAAAFHY